MVSIICNASYYSAMHHLGVLLLIALWGFARTSGTAVQKVAFMNSVVKRALQC